MPKKFNPIKNLKGFAHPLKGMPKGVKIGVVKKPRKIKLKTI